MFDLLLKGGRIYDGSGMPGYNGDVAIQDGKIVELGRLNRGAKRTLNVDGLAVAPGFIDPHTHLDAQLFWDPLGTSSCFHGVTSVIVGNCGLSLAPAKPEDRDAVIELLGRVNSVLGVLSEQDEALDPSLIVDIESKIEQRNAARRDRDFNRADQIRNELATLGIILEDTPQGTKWKPK